MPNKRWWDFEDASISIGDIEADKRDIAKMIVMDFALVSDNDWVMIPIPIKIGSLTRINSLIVTDVFGERFLIRSLQMRMSRVKKEKDGVCSNFYMLLKLDNLIEYQIFCSCLLHLDPHLRVLKLKRSVLMKCLI